MKSDMIERSEVVGYLNFLAEHAMKGMSTDFRKRQPQVDDHAVMLLVAGLTAAANQIAEGTIDKQSWS